MIKAVIFDVDGVLLDSFEANLKFFSDLMNHFGHRSPTREEFPSLFHRPMKDIIKELSKLENEQEIDKIWTAGKDGEVSYPHELLSGPENLEKIIKKLSKKYILGIVTSRTTENVFRFFPMTKIKQYFKISVNYQDTKNHKPHPEPLLLSAEKLGVLPEECVYVGDVENDVVAAKAAGMKAVIYSKNSVSSADANVSLFSDLENAIDNL